jgi:hypothetical protein
LDHIYIINLSSLDDIRAYVRLTDARRQPHLCGYRWPQPLAEGGQQHGGGSCTAAAQAPATAPARPQLTFFFWPCFIRCSGTFLRRR